VRRPKRPMIDRHRFAPLAVGAAALAAGADLAALEPSQFVAGWPLEIPSERGFFDVALTVEMYQTARRLEEFAVLDFGGDPMPFYRVTEPERGASERRIVLSASPVYAPPPNDGAAEQGVGNSRAGNGSLVRSEDTAAQIVAFVVDARGVEAAPFALELTWRPLPEPFLTEVRIEQSQNLSDWRQVGRGSIAALSIDGTRVTHGRVPVVADAGGYFRVTSSRGIADWYLESAALVT
jgi:hypothetical protein